MKKMLIGQAILACHMGLCAQLVPSAKPPPPPAPMSDGEQQALLRDLRNRVETLEKKTSELERKLSPSREPSNDGPARIRIQPR